MDQQPTNVRFPSGDLRRIDAYANRAGLSRSEAIRRLVLEGLRAAK